MLGKLDCLHCRQMVGGEKKRREEKERREERRKGRVGEEDRAGGEGESEDSCTDNQSLFDFRLGKREVS